MGGNMGCFVKKRMHTGVAHGHRPTAMSRMMHGERTRRQAHTSARRDTRDTHIHLCANTHRQTERHTHTHVLT